MVPRVVLVKTAGLSQQGVQMLWLVVTGQASLTAADIKDH